MALSRTWPFRNRLLQKAYHAGFKRADARRVQQNMVILRHLDRLNADLCAARAIRQQELMEKAELERQLGIAMKLLGDCGRSIALH